MADYDSSLPIRSEADGTDERVQVKVVDSTNPDTQQGTVDTDGNFHVQVMGDRADDAAEVALVLSEEGRPNPRGDYEVDDNSKPATVGLIAHSRDASPAETQSTERLTSIQDSGGTVRALDIALHDEAGEPYSSSNPVPVSVEESEGDEIVDYDTAAAIAKDATSNHDYTVSASRTLLIEELWASASGKMKIEVQLETAAASGVFNTIFVGFNSTANPNIRIPAEKIPKQVTGAIVRIIRTNLDNQAQDLYSTIVGLERA